MSPQPVNYSRFCYTILDQGGVHANSGILNKAAYRMITSKTIGPEKTRQIYYKAYDFLLPGSHFYDFREALKKAAKNLYPDQYTALSRNIDLIYNKAGIKAPPARAILKYGKAKQKVSWHLGRYDRFGSYFVPYYSGKLDGVSLRFNTMDKSSDNYVDVMVYDGTLSNLIGSATVKVSNFRLPFYVPLGGVSYDDSFFVLVIPHASSLGILSDDGNNTPLNSQAVNVVHDSYSGYFMAVKENFYIRPHVSYDPVKNF